MAQTELNVRIQKTTGIQWIFRYKWNEKSINDFAVSFKRRKYRREISSVVICDLVRRMYFQVHVRVCICTLAGVLECVSARVNFHHDFRH